MKCLYNSSGKKLRIKLSEGDHTMRDDDVLIVPMLFPGRLVSLFGENDLHLQLHLCTFADSSDIRRPHAHLPLFPRSLDRAATIFYSAESDNTIFPEFQDLRYHPMP